MSLPDFIRDRHEEIIREFAAFAKTLMPPDVEMTEAEWCAVHLRFSRARHFRTSPHFPIGRADRRPAEYTSGMAKRQAERLNESSINALDVALLDVFAQAEAMLRCGPEIQRNLIRLRDGNGPTGRAERNSILKKIDEAAGELHEESKAIVPLTRDIRQAARRLE